MEMKYCENCGRYQSKPNSAFCGCCDSREKRMFDLVRNPETNWMSCNSCRRTAIANPTGMCLSCQGGFDDKPMEDDFMFHTRYHDLKEKKDAIEERLEQSDSIEEHQGAKE